MHTLEERIQRLETSCRRWRLLTLAVAGFTVAHFAIRTPLEAQFQTTPKELKAATIICSSLMIKDDLDGDTLDGYFRVSRPGVRLQMATEKGSIRLSSGVGPSAQLVIEQGREEIDLSADRLSFKREEQQASHLKVQIRELIAENAKSGGEFQDIEKNLPTYKASTTRQYMKCRFWELAEPAVA